MFVGYARVSTHEQDTALQLDALRAAGVHTIYQDKSSGVGRRPNLGRAIDHLRPGDVLVVWKLDRIARSLSDLLAIIARVKKAGAAIKSLTEPIDTTHAFGNFTLQVLGAVAELERSMIRERVMAGQAAAMARGKRWGPPRTLPKDKEAELVGLYLKGGVSYRDLGARFGVSWGVARNAVYRVTRPLTYYKPRR